MSGPRLQLDFDTAWHSYLNDPIALPADQRGDPHSVRAIPDLLAVADDVDAMLLDGFGVLNCGDSAVPGMTAMLQELAERGVSLLVVSNGATGQIQDAVKKYRDLGFDLSAPDILTSRDATREALAQHHRENPQWVWGVSPMGGRPLDDLPGHFVCLSEAGAWDLVDGFLLVTTLHWEDAHSTQLRRALARRPRPVWVANPDVTAPFIDHYSLEPGYVARCVAGIEWVETAWFGKPHPDVYALALSRLKLKLPALSRDRVLMVGDSPHTDILGARANGLKSCLTVDYGLLRGQDLRSRLAECGIWPDFVMSERGW